MAKTIYVNNTDLTLDKRFTFLTESVVTAGTTIRVQSIVGFENPGTSSGQVICIGEIGNNRTEIVTTNQSSDISLNYREITLGTNLLGGTGLAFDHPQDTKVYIIDWNRVDFQWSSTITGTKSTLIAYPLNIRPFENETFLVDKSQTSGYYFSRFNETIGNTNSDWSDAVPFGGFDDNTVFMIKKRAVDELGEQINGVTITHEFLNQCLWEARREYHEAPGKRPFRRQFNFIMASSALTGSYRIELPTNVEKPYTAENIYGIRIGQGYDLSYYDKKEWDFDYWNVGHSSLAKAYNFSPGDQDLYVTNVRDFNQPSGSVSVEGTVIGYSAVGISGGTLRISTQGKWNASAGSEVWQNMTYGYPTKFTAFADPGGSAWVYFNMAIDTAYIGQNIYLDYYRTPFTSTYSDSDILDEPQYDMFVHFLKAKIKDRRNKGAGDITQDSDYKLWLAKKAESLSRENLESNIRIKPGVSHLPIPN